MNTSISKTDFIKFNVSPTFKTLAAKKAKANGMTLSELGRMLFGAFVSDIMSPPASPTIIKMAKQAKKDYEAGKTTSFTNTKDMLAWLDSIR